MLDYAEPQHQNIKTTALMASFVEYLIFMTTFRYAQQILKPYNSDQDTFDLNKTLNKYMMIEQVSAPQNMRRK